MRDFGIDKGLVEKRETDSRNQRGWENGFFSFRKMFRDYFGKLNVAFFDTCCEAANDVTARPVHYDDTANSLEFFNGTTWVDVPLDEASVPDDITVDTILEATADAGVLIETVKLENGGISNSGETMYVPFYPTTAAQALSGAGAVNVTAFLTKYTSTGAAQALTLASGTQIGQRKKVSHVVDGGSGILTSVYVGGTTITFTSVGEFADLLWTGAAWAVLELGNTATPGTPPALA